MCTLQRSREKMAVGEDQLGLDGTGSGRGDLNGHCGKECWIEMCSDFSRPVLRCVGGTAKKVARAERRRGLYEPERLARYP